MLYDLYKRNSSSGSATGSGVKFTHYLSQVANEEFVASTIPVFWMITGLVLSVQLLAMMTILIILRSRTPLLVVGDILPNFLKRPDMICLASPKDTYDSGKCSSMLAYLSVPLYIWRLAALILGMLPSLKPGFTLPNIEYVLHFFK